MSSDTPKQFIELNGLPILMHTISRFAEEKGEVQIVVVLPQAEVSTWRKLCKIHSFSIPHVIVYGGQSRFQSVQNGLNFIPHDDGLVAIHDGVRPFVSSEIIENSFDIAQKAGSAITAVPMKDSIRKHEKGKSRTVNRDEYWTIQTPQTFKIKSIKKAYQVAYSESFTDDASVYEESGQAIHLISGDYKNIKITTPEDLVVAEAFLKQENT